jgi:hypothetical protein
MIITQAVRNVSFFKAHAKNLLLFILLIAASQYASAQCTGCTSTITTNTAVNVNSGQTICINYSGTFSQSINFNGGTLCIGPGTIVSSSISMSSGTTLNIYGKITSSLTQNGGAVTVYSGGTFAGSGMTINGGTFTIDAGGTGTIPSINFPSGYVFTNYGTVTMAGFTINSGSTVNLSGTSQTISGSVSNNGTFTLAGPATISGAYSTNSGSTSNFSGGITVTGSVSNNGTINVNGPLTINGSYSSNSGASIDANSSGCNGVTAAGGYSGNGSFNGNGHTLSISPAQSCSSCMGTGSYSAPTQQPTTFSASLSSSTVSGSFTSPSASIGGYIVLRYIGSAAASDNPVNGASYSVGSAVGTSTVAAIVTSTTTGTKTFTDNMPSNNCGKTAYYRVFSFDGTGGCYLYYTTGPLTGSVSLPAVTAATITASGATTFCSGSSVTLTASSGASYAWSNNLTTPAITETTAATYTVTVTNALGCTSSASKSLVVNTSPAFSISPASTTVCSGSAVTISTTVTGSTSYTYKWSGPGSYTGNTTNVTFATTVSANSGTYSLTVTAANTCTASASATLSVVTCLSVSGSLFDDANGDGIVNGVDAKTAQGTTLYAVLSDTTGNVVAVGPIATNGAFSLGQMLPNTAGYHLAVSTSGPTIGTTATGYAWPAAWTGTKAAYGSGNAAGTGLYSANMALPVKTAAANITNVLIGFDRLPTSTISNVSITYPHLYSKESLVGLNSIAGNDPEDGVIANHFAITSVANMNGNKLFYDGDSNNVLSSSEQIMAYHAITNYVPSRLVISFTGAGSTSAGFTYAAIDAAGNINASPSSYTVSWGNEALPVTLIFFTAEKKKDDVGTINWATATEINNAYFEVERSADAKEWTTIGHIAGAGNSNIMINYTLEDDKPLHSVNYYRLKQVDDDGIFTYSEIAQLDFSDAAVNTELNIYPNPLAQNKSLYLNVTNTTDLITHISISNESGMVSYNEEVTPSPICVIPPMQAESGIYFVTAVISGNKQRTKEIVIR